MDVFKIMEKEQYLSVIRLLFLKGKSRSEIKERLVAVYSDSSPSMETVKIWFNDFFKMVKVELFLTLFKRNPKEF